MAIAGAFVISANELWGYTAARFAAKTGIRLGDFAEAEVVSRICGYEILRLLLVPWNFAFWLLKLGTTSMARLMARLRQG